MRSNDVAHFEIHPDFMCRLSRRRLDRLSSRVDRIYQREAKANQNCTRRRSRTDTRRSQKTRLTGTAKVRPGLPQVRFENAGRRTIAGNGSPPYGPRSQASTGTAVCNAWPFSLLRTSRKIAWSPNHVFTRSRSRASSVATNSLHDGSGRPAVTCSICRNTRSRSGGGCSRNLSVPRK